MSYCIKRQGLINLQGANSVRVSKSELPDHHFNNFFDPVLLPGAKSEQQNLKNEKDLRKLLIKFLVYYIFEFNYEKEIVCLGHPRTKNTAGYYYQKGLNIEDPFKNDYNPSKIKN